MKNMIDSIKLLRNKADDILKEYCNSTGEDFKEIRAYFIQQADQYNLKLPIDFYTDYYNLVMEFNKEVQIKNITDKF